MKAKRILTLLLASVLLLTCLTACGNKQPQVINPNGEVDVSEEPNRTPQKEEHMPVYDYKNLPASNFLEGKEIEISYYASKLNERNMISYNEIYEAALTFQSEVVLSKKISPAALMQIMNIIYLDTPELFMLETIYEYDTESNGNVHKVYLKYNMTPEDYAAMNEVLIQTLVMDISDFKYAETELEAELKIIEDLEGRLYTNKAFEIEKFHSKDPLNSFFTLVRTQQGNHLAYAKLFTHFCRKVGIESAVVVGELTNTDYAKEIGLEIGQYKTPEQAIQQTVEGTHVKGNIDYSNFYAWNIIKLNESWYHVDTLFPRLWLETKEDLRNLDIKFARTTLNVDDYTISQSRLFHINEDLLGLIPECNNKIFQSLYREGRYFLNYNANQMVIAINDRLDELVEFKYETILYQFGSEDTYDIFISTIDSTIKTYNENNSNVIQNYRIIENKETLSVVITGLIYY